METFGVATVTIILILLISFTSWGFINAINGTTETLEHFDKLKAECELNLKRTQTCVMQFVPMEEE